MKANLLIIFLFFVQTVLSQTELHPVPDLPTKELYDLHVDNKGYLWIAHGLGISRFDGLNFINYVHPLQINLRSTDIVEDKFGRIWFHNLSGQVFYIEKGKIQYLDAYDYKGENQTPRMAIAGNELLVTSYKGLFVLNTSSFKTKFLPFVQPSPTEAVSLTVVNNKVLLFNHHMWYIYDNNTLTAIRTQPLQLPKDNFIQLQPSTLNDTIFLAANPSGMLYKLLLEKNYLKLVGKVAHHDFINGVSVGKEAWVHTRNTSYDLTDGTQIRNHDLTDIVRGKEGNIWYSSRREGLLVSYRPSFWKKINLPIDKDDYIRSLNANGGYFFAGTQRGTLYMFESDSSKPAWKHELFNGLGSIDFIRHIRDDRFIVGSSTSTFIVNAREKKIVDSLPIKAIFDVGIDSSSFYLATPVGVYIVPYLKSSEDKKRWLQIKQEQYPFYDWKNNGPDTYLLFPQRTRSIRFDSLRQQVYAATKNGLFEVSKKGIHPYLIDGKEVYATSVSYKKSSLYIATVNDGLWIINNEGTKHFTTANNLASNTLIRVKVTEDHLWLFEKEGIQVLDIHTHQVLQNIDLPKVEGSNVLDVTEMGNNAYLATAEGIYKVPLNVIASKTTPKGFLDYIIVDGKDTLAGTTASLPYNQNDVQFFFSSPAFYDPERVSFRYRLKGAEKEWRTTNPGERMIRYSALPSGDYVFELYAVNSDDMQQEEVISYGFSIAKPWWRMWWFYLLANLAVMLVAYLLVRNRMNQRLKLELMRSNISRDLHDDIGATLSSINFYIALAETEEDKQPYLHTIRENVGHVVNSLDDLIWSINPQNDTTEQFINRMKEYVGPLLNAARIQCHFQYDPRIVNLRLDLVTKRNLYLLFKEMVNNVLKHSQCRNCYVRLEYHRSQLSLSVTDDGKGFDPEKLKKNRNGLLNMRARAKRMKGEIEISSAEKKGSRLAVKIPV